MDIMAILSIAIGIITAYWGIWYAKKTRIKTHLTLFNENWLSLLTTFQDNFKTLKIEYYQLPINKNVYYYQGSIINTGNTDIDKEKVYEPLEIALPEDYKIIESKISRKSTDKIEVCQVNKPHGVLFEWDLLKSKENFSFELIIETKEPISRQKLSKEIKIIHRVSDLQNISVVNIWDAEKRIGFWKNYGKYFVWIPLFLAALSLCAYSIFYIVKEPTVRALVKDTFNKSGEKVVLSRLKNDLIVITSDKRIDTVSFKNANSQVIVSPEVVIYENNIFWITLLMSIILLAGIGTALLYNIKEDKIALQRNKLL